MRTYFTDYKFRNSLGLLLGLLLPFYCGAGVARTITELRSIAFYYGEMPVPEPLNKFEFVVLEPASGFEPKQGLGHTPHWISYVSVGEVIPSRDYFSSIPAPWLIGLNSEWNSYIIDQTAEGWPSFFVEHVITPLWNKGYSGFFLDTLDSYQLVTEDEQQRQQHQQGLIAVIHAIHHRFPDARIILNRGFELLPKVHKQVYAVAFESLFKGWSEANGKYIDVASADRDWLLNQVKIIKKKYGLPVIAIDYCFPTDTACSHDTAKRIQALGLVPYIGDGHLLTVNSELSNK